MEQNKIVEYGYRDLAEAVDGYEEFFFKLWDGTTSEKDKEIMTQMWMKISYIIGHYAFPYAIHLEDHKVPGLLRDTTEG